MQIDVEINCDSELWSSFIENAENILNDIAPRVFDKVGFSEHAKHVEISILLTDNKSMQILNNDYREKDKPTNVLSFPISDTEGEIFINLETKKQEAGKFEMSFKKYIGYLVIHGALHLKGLDHGDEMDKLEDKFLKKFF